MFSAKDLKGLQRDLRNFDKDDLLELFGLESRRTTADALVPTVSAFAVGLLVGAGLGLLLAPKPGTQLRSDLRTRLGSGSTEGAMASGGAGATSAESRKL